ncbi:alpha/beta fold hydrolase [Nocardia sp. CDC160]|uniref:alpha/beta fold hydrolase n=1 Tax=Nocardia sp. CDC160 TaxID=3112166 RepID=UPI002DC024B1|nr:alpha/beta fold hydrolase [Nocardia sp. CDC160]MEC3919369.1 alpha/beta fold hydrolase [Nocardia sp. CDC160]
MEPPTRSLRVGAANITYDERGQGDRSVVLLPGLFMPRRMHERLADALAAKGLRVVSMEPLGFGEADRPEGYWHYTMAAYARQVIALLDALGLEQTVLLGTSAGANIALATAVRAPERIRGLVIESPVLEHAMPTCAACAVPGLLLGTYGAPLARGVAALAKRVPRTRGSIPDLLLTWVSYDPRRSAEALQGIISGGVLVPRDERRAIAARTLVIGHRFDPVHPRADDRGLAADVRRGRYLPARSIVELRRAPERLAPAIAGFIADCWGDPAAYPPAAIAASHSR